MGESRMTNPAAPPTGLKTRTLTPAEAERLSKLVGQLAREKYDADNLEALCRIVYVRALLRVREVAGGRTKSAIPLAQSVTASVLKMVVGFYFTGSDVAALLHDDEEPSARSAK
jgi:hypothetical protein